jgi:hypothetical protein
MADEKKDEGSAIREHVRKVLEQLGDRTRSGQRMRSSVAERVTAQVDGQDNLPGSVGHSKRPS